MHYYACIHDIVFFNVVLNLLLHVCMDDSAADLVLEEKEEDMELGEITEAKRAAIAATLRRHSTRLCEGISVMCLATILYTDNVMDSLVFVGMSNAPQKSQYLVRKILQAVEDNATKFEALCHSISLAHSHTYTRQIWSE